MEKLEKLEKMEKIQTIQTIAKNSLNIEDYEDFTGKTQKASPEVLRLMISNPNNMTIKENDILKYYLHCKINQQVPGFDNYAFLDSKGNLQIRDDYRYYIRRASVCPDYRGCKSGVIVLDKNGNEKNNSGAFYLPNEILVGGWCEVFIKDRESTIARVALQEYIQMKDGTDNEGNLTKVPTEFWNSKPGTMIQKVAISQAHQAAMPNVFVRTYVAEEVDYEEVEQK